MYYTDLATLVPSADAELVDLSLGHISPLLCSVQLMLDLPVLGHVGVGLLLLRREREGDGGRGEKERAENYRGCHSSQHKSQCH